MNDTTWTNNIDIKCDNVKCQYVNRYSTERGNETFYKNFEKEVDYKNMILNEQCDSIHTFIFHTMQRSYTQTFQNIRYKYDENNDEKEEEHQHRQVDIWNSKIENISECNVQQIIWIMNNYIFDNLNQKIRDTILSYKSDIIKYIEQNKWDGKQLKEMGRKCFLNTLATFFNNKKLKAALGQLYRAVMQYNIVKLFEEDEENKYDNENNKKEPEEKQKLNHKFETSITEEERTEQCYSFGIQYRYTTNLQQHPFYVKSKHLNLKKELKEYFIRVNKEKDSKILLECQRETIQSMQSKSLIENPTEMSYIDAKRENFDSIAMSLIENPTEMSYIDAHIDPVSRFFYNYVYKMASIFESENIASKADSAERLMTIEDNVRQLVSMMGKLCHKLSQENVMKGTNFASIIFLKLLKLKKQKLDQNAKVITENIDKIAKVIKNNLAIFVKKLRTSAIDIHCDEHKEYTEKCDQCTDLMERQFPWRWNQIEWRNVMKHLSNNISAYFQTVKSNTSEFLKPLLQDICIVYQYVSNVEFLHQYFEVAATKFRDENKIIEENIEHILQNKDCKQQWQAILRNEKPNIEVFYNFVFSTLIQQLHHSETELVPKKILSYQTLSSMLKATEQCLRNEIIPQLTPIVTREKTVNLEQMINIMRELFTDDLYGDLYDELKTKELKADYAKIVIKTLKQQLNKNKIKYIDVQAENRCRPFVIKAEEKIKVPSVKKLKASWYQGINKYHNINPNQRITEQHVLALILYSQFSDLCTVFRATYRKESKSELVAAQKKRHSQYAYFGRLLYETFVFYGSTDSKVEVLYHGIDIPLVFNTLYCTFSSPTSTTTAESVACQFGGGNGIVIKFKSCGSEKYIKTFDMDLFTCFDNEEEHLIFETRLHIKKIFLQRVCKWVPSSLLNRL
eukprot:340764_1